MEFNNLDYSLIGINMDEIRFATDPFFLENVTFVNQKAKNFALAQTNSPRKSMNMVK